MGTVVTLFIVITIVSFSIKSMIKSKKAGKSIQCGGDCSHCGGHCH